MTWKDLASDDPSRSLPPDVAPGRIGLRQSTFWRLIPVKGSCARVHFDGNAESRFGGKPYDTAEIFDTHPLLAHHNEDWASLYVAGATRSAVDILAALDEIVKRATAGWRGVNEYLNSVAKSVLESGYGLLMHAPESVVCVSRDLLRDHGVESTTSPGRTAGTTRRVLVLGKSFVVAKDFRFERERAASP